MELLTTLTDQNLLKYSKYIILWLLLTVSILMDTQFEILDKNKQIFYLMCF